MMSLGLMEAFAFSLPIVCAMVCMVLMLLDACRALSRITIPSFY